MAKRTHQSKRPSQPHSLGSEERLTVSIYQNSVHVSGLLQQAHNMPLLVDEQHETSSQGSSNKSGARKAGASLDIKAKAPFVGEIGGSLNGEGDRTTEENHGFTDRSVRNFVYSQAYYLALVRSQLHRLGQIKTVTGAEDSRLLISGDFVEYEASFRPNQIGALLDILSPDLVAEIVKFRKLSQGFPLFEGYDFDEMKKFSLKNMEEADAQAALAKAVTRAVRADFRSEETRELYGQVGFEDNIVTAVTICDNEHFVVQDVDRILDGEFTVLGKVISAPAIDVPILERNKILERIQPAAVDSLFSTMQNQLDTQTNSGSGAELFDGMTGAQVMDLELSSRINGLSFRVIPIAIYA